MPLRIENAIDLHCHFGPDAVGTIVTDASAPSPLENTKGARDSGHAAIVLKSHSFPSMQLAAEVERQTPGIRVFGGICTDQATGGLNPDAVATALRLGAKIVWLPTINSHQDWLNGRAQVFDIRGEGLRVVDEAGEPLPLVREIFDLVRQHDAILATGHVTAAEHYAVIKAFAREGRLLVTHAGEPQAGPRLTPEQCRELAELGATIELCAYSCGAHHGAAISHADMARMIRTIGCAHCVLATDYGFSRSHAEPAAGFREFMEQLWAEGITEAELTQMAAARPAELLGL